jgi:hypothetical protein
MTIAMNQQVLIFTPTIISKVINTLKDKAIDIKDRAMFSTIHKIISIAFDESLQMKNHFSLAKLELTVDEMKSIDFDTIYDQLESTEENLWSLHEQFEKSTNVYEIQLFDLVDATLDNFAKINNILGYFESQIIQDRLKSA